MWVEASQLYPNSLQSVVEEEEHNGHTGPGEGRIGEGVPGEEHNSYHKGPYMAGTVAVDTVAVDMVAVDTVAVDTVAVDTAVAVVDVAVDTVVVDFEVVVVVVVDFEVVVVLVGRGMELVVVHTETGTLNHKSGHLWVWLDLTAQRMLLTQMGVVWKSLCQ